MVFVLHYLSMEDQSRNEKAGQKARSEDYKRETEQLLKFHRQDKILAPGLFLKILEVYLLFVAVVGGTGVLAFYSHHDTILKIVLITSVVLVVAAPVAVIWYLLVAFRTKQAATPAAENAAAGKQNLWIRFTQSAIGRFVQRLGDNRIFRLLNFIFSFVSAICMISYAIIRFPLHPRSSLVLIVMYMALFFAELTLELVRTLERRFQRDIKEVWDFNDRLRAVLLGVMELLRYVDATAAAALGIAKSASKFIDDTEPGHMEMHKTTADALRAIHHSTEVMATVIIKPDQVDAPPGENDEPKGG